MQRVRWLWQAAFVVVALVCMTGGARAQQQTVAGSAGRGPRFLYAAPGKKMPVEIDVSTVPLFRRRVSLRLGDVSLRDALAAIARESGLRFNYSQEIVPLETRVRLVADDIPVAAALTAVLLETKIDVLLGADRQVALVKRVALAVPLVGTVMGRVTERGANAPIASAQVTVMGAGLARYTDDKGQYRIVGVPVGEHEITVRRLGFEAMSHRVRVLDGEAVTVDFVMGRVATALTEVVTTATGERSRIEVGNSIGTIKADSVVATTLIRNVSDLLTARTPGVVVMNTSGLVGAPSSIRIRGVASATLSNDPIIILDGMRLTPASNTGLATTIGSASIQQVQVSGFSVNGKLAPARLDDIDPNTIESIDVLRGPSASSLYGTDAAAGVIVIKTKKAAIGSWRFNVLADQGSSSIPGKFPQTWVGYGHLINGASTAACFSTNWISVANILDGGCVQDSVRSYQPLNDPRLTTLGIGTARNASVNLSGGTEQLREFLSLRLSDATGIIKLSDAEQDRIARMWGSGIPSWMKHPNTEQNLGGMSRTNIRLSGNFDLSVTANGLYRSTLSDGTGTPGDGFSALATTAGGRAFFDTLIYLPAEAQRARMTSVAKRGYGAATANYTPLPWLVLRGTLGGDYTFRSDDALGRASDCTAVLAPATGCPSGHTNSRGETYVTTVDAGAQATWAPRGWLSLRTSIGEQYSRTTFYNLTAGNNFSTNLAFGTELLTPSPIATSGTPQLYTVTENRDESATAGWYVEETAALRERLFLTAAFRQDVASAFGRSVNAKAPVYPKYSLSWLVSDEAFFPRTSMISSFRLRAAYGHSGQEARQTAVLNNFLITSTIVDGISAPGIALSALGNPALRPERTAELEGGFDLSLMENERVRIEATMYRKLSNDAISSNVMPVSYGVSGTGTSLFSQSVNLGQVENRGWELSTTAKVIETRSVAWDLTVNATRNVNKLVSCIGVIPGIGCLASTINRGNYAGYPLNSSFGHTIIGYEDLNGDGMLSYNGEVQFDYHVRFLGSSYPEGELTYLSSMSFGGGAWQMNASVDHILGLGRLTTTSTTAGGSGDLVYRAQVDPTAPLGDQAAILQTGNFIGGAGWMRKVNVMRIQEVSLTWNIPKHTANRLLRSKSAALTFAGRNLALWTNYARKDPNVDSGFGSFDGRDNGATIPQPRTWTLRVNLGY